MFKHLPKLAIGLSALAVAQIFSLAIAQSASAFGFNQDWIEVDTGDLNQSFTVDFNGNSSTKDVTGLTSQATFTFKGFQSNASNTKALFDIRLTNTSTGILSKTSGLGFNVYKDMYQPTLPLASTGNTSTGLFTSAIKGGSLPNGFGNIDICFTIGTACQGTTSTSSGGVDNNPQTTLASTGTFSATLNLTGINVQKFALAHFGVGYQNITGTVGGVNYSGASGTGKGKINYDLSGGPKKIPEPTTTAALGFFAVSALGTRKRKAVAQA